MIALQNLKRNDTNELTYKTERDSQIQRTILRLLWEDRERDSQVVWDGRVHTAIIKMDNQ